MESRIHGIFLSIARLAVALPVLASGPALAQDNETPQVIEPKVERRDIDVAAFDTEDFELTGFVGLMSVEDFESNAVYGVRLAYHVTEWLFTEATLRHHRCRHVQF